jgi:hypothetical protein
MELIQIIKKFPLSFLMNNATCRSQEKEPHISFLHCLSLVTFPPEIFLTTSRGKFVEQPFIFMALTPALRDGRLWYFSLLYHFSITLKISGATIQRPIPPSKISSANGRRPQILLLFGVPSNTHRMMD